VATLIKVQCRFCKGEHWTTKCPYKDNLSFMDQPAEKSDTTPATSTAANTASQQSNDRSAGGAPGDSQTTGGVGRWVSSSARRGTGTAYPSNERGGSRTGGGGGGGYGGRSGGDNEATVRVTNLPEETQEQDLRDLFQPFGYVSRVFLAKDKQNNTSKGFAFITFNEKKDVQYSI